MQKKYPLKQNKAHLAYSIPRNVRKQNPSYHSGIIRLNSKTIEDIFSTFNQTIAIKFSVH